MNVQQFSDSLHGGRKASKNGPTSPMKPDLPEKKTMFGSDGRFWAGKRQPALTLDPENRNDRGSPKPEGLCPNCAQNMSGISKRI